MPKLRIQRLSYLSANAPDELQEVRKRLSLQEARSSVEQIGIALGFLPVVSGFSHAAVDEQALSIRFHPLPQPRPTSD